MKTKKCIKCNNEYEISGFYFQRNKSSKDGFSNICKECNSYQFGWGYYDKLEFRKQGLKWCKKCNRILPLDEIHFFHSKNSQDGLTSQCKECSGQNFGVFYVNLVYKNNIPDGHIMCTKCKEILPKTSYYFARTNDNFHTTCKKCDSKRKEYGEPLEIKEIIDGKLQCNVCEEWLPANNDFFHNDSTKKFGLTYTCKECSSKKSKEWTENNRDRVRKRNIKWRQNPENRRKNNICSNNYAKTPKGKLMRRMGSEKRRTRLLNLPNSLSQQEWIDTLEYFNYTCVYCGMTEKESLISNKESLHQEHIIPLSRNGGYIKKNIVPSCRCCNSSKGNKTLEEFYQVKDTFTEERYLFILEFINKYSSINNCCDV